MVYNNCESIFSNLPTLKTIIEQYKYEITIPFFEANIHVSKSENIYRILRKKYMIVADNCKFIKELNKTYITFLEEIYEERNKPYTDSILATLLTDIHETIANDAISYGILDVDSEAITLAIDTLNGFFPLREAYANFLIDKTLSLDFQSYKLANGIDIFTPYSEIVSPDEFCYETDFIETVKKGIRKSVANVAVFLLVVAFDKANDEELAPIDFPELDGNGKRSAEAMWHNLMELPLTNEQQYEIVRNVISLDPLNEQYYNRLIKKYPDRLLEIANVANFYGIELDYNLLHIQPSDLNKYNIVQASTICPFCKIHVKPNWKYCGACGTSLTCKQ